jgi:hypothetical protein
MSWTRAVLALALVIVPAVAGCAGREGDSVRPGTQTPSDSSQADPRWDSCQQADLDAGPRPPADPADLPRPDDDFAAVAAVVCGADNQNQPDGSEYLIGTEDRARDVAELVAALRLPDEPNTHGICTSDNPTVPWFVLLDAQGRWVRPGVPRDQCGKHRAEVRAAAKALNLTRISTWPIKQIRSAEAGAAKCGQQWSNEVPSHARVGGWATTVGPLFGDRSPARLCVYRVPASEQRSKHPTGEFHYGGLLSADQGAAIDTAVRNAPRANAACTKPTSRFAVLRATTGEEAAHVELDGCRRVSITPVNAPPSLQQATSAVLAMLTDPKTR